MIDARRMDGYTYLFLPFRRKSLLALTCKLPLRMWLTFHVKMVCLTREISTVHEVFLEVQKKGKLSAKLVL